jgi:hypothetical protein
VWDATGSLILQFSEPLSSWAGTATDLTVETTGGAAIGTAAFATAGELVWLTTPVPAATGTSWAYTGSQNDFVFASGHKLTQWAGTALPYP